MNHAPLFTGINGFGLAADGMGWNQPFHCEIDEFCQRVIQYYWPNSIPYYDIKKTDFTRHRGTIDVLSGGFPCQPYSLAGKRNGKEDERHLWPEMLRAIREIAPIYVVGENVYGLVNWDGGLVFDEVQSDLEGEGYEVWPVILPACAVNAPHRRDRVWFVAYSYMFRNNRNKRTERDNVAWKQPTNTQQTRDERTSEASGFMHERNVANTQNTRVKSMQQGRKNGIYEFGITSDTQGLNKQWDGICEKQQEREAGRSCSGVNGEGAFTDTKSTGRKRSNRIQESIRLKYGAWDNWPTVEPTVRNRNDGFPSELSGITFPKWRNESIKAGGNAIVPQIAFEIFKAIEQHNNSFKN